MNAAKIKAIEDGLSGIARKVLDAVPIADTWAVHTIANEVKRVTGSAPEQKIVSGCLETLRHAGLVRETRGKWIRVAVKESAGEPDESAQKVVELRAPQEEKRTKSPREMLSDIAIAMMDLAVKIEDVAAEIDRADKRHGEKTAKLRQLQELLQGIGAP